MGRHVVLLGDSIFDNAAYIDGGPDVAAHLRSLLPQSDTVTLAAVDGSVTSDIAEQLRGVGSEATHLVVSAGGNDILHNVALLTRAVPSVADALALLAAERAGLAGNHARMLAALGDKHLPLAVCTIYDANHPPPGGSLVATAMGLFNDAITRNVHALGADLIDLRLVCTDRSDYANPIEPSAQGGAKIAACIARWLDAGPQPEQRTRVFH